MGSVAGPKALGRAWAIDLIRAVNHLDKVVRNGINVRFTSSSPRKGTSPKPVDDSLNLPNTIMTTGLLNTKRIQPIDFIRGIALLGILIMNTQTYSLFAFLRPQQVYALGLDRPDTYAPTQFLIHLFVKGQFYTIYSFLFGLGFYLMWQKNYRAGLKADRLFRRRLWVLLGIGLIHAFVFWFGDILHNYALLGFSLLYFNRKSVATLVKWIAGLVVLVILIQTVNELVFPATAQAQASSQQQFDTVIMTVVRTWQQGSVWDVMNLQKLGVAMLHVMTVENGLAAYVHYEIMFLLGLIAGKAYLINGAFTLKTGYWRRAFWLLLVGLFLKGLSCLPILEVHLLPASQLPGEQLLVSVTEFVGTPLLTISYLIGLAWVSERKPSQLINWISQTGRMGLTNYLVQTLLCMGLFYGYGFGLSGRLPLLATFVPILSIYSFQVWYSHCWLSHHRQGPVEWLWRRLTYGRLLSTTSEAATRL